MLDPRLVPRAPAFWTQTTDVALLAAKRCNLACADACPGSHCAHRLLYLAAVRGDRLPGPLFHNGQIGGLCGATGSAAAWCDVRL